MQIQFVRAEQCHLSLIKSWFSTAEELISWAGPKATFGLDINAFCQQLSVDELHSVVMLNSDEEVLGFGQFYLRAGRCHLGRLCVSPLHRGQRLIEPLCAYLEKVGTSELGASQCSLFVLKSNQSACRSYIRMGFKTASYPGQMPDMQGLQYMIK